MTNRNYIRFSTCDKHDHWRMGKEDRVPRATVKKCDFCEESFHYCPACMPGDAPVSCNRCKGISDNVRAFVREREEGWGAGLAYYLSSEHNYFEDALVANADTVVGDRDKTRAFVIDDEGIRQACVDFVYDILVYLSERDPEVPPVSPVLQPEDMMGR